MSFFSYIELNEIGQKFSKFSKFYYTRADQRRRSQKVKFFYKKSYIPHFTQNQKITTFCILNLRTFF